MAKESSVDENKDEQKLRRGDRESVRGRGGYEEKEGFETEREARRDERKVTKLEGNNESLPTPPDLLLSSLNLPLISLGKNDPEAVPKRDELL